MNRDEILNMPAGREMDALVAEKVMGIVIMDDKPCNHRGCLHHVTHPCEGCGRYHPSLVPHYSTDIAAAWQVVEKVKQPKFNVQLLWFNSAQGWLWSFSIKLGIWATAKTAPLAICRAALLAVHNE